MKKIKPLTNQDFKNSEAFHVDYALMKAQDIISSLLDKSDVKQKELAKHLHLSQSQVSRLLNDERNLTLKSFARVCFHLGYELTFGFRAIANKAGWVAEQWIFPYVGSGVRNIYYTKVPAPRVLVHKHKSKTEVLENPWSRASLGSAQPAKVPEYFVPQDLKAKVENSYAT